MTTMQVSYDTRFDVVEYIRKLRNVGVAQEVAEVQAQELEHVVNGVLQQSKQHTHEIFENKELSTKGDLAKTKLELQKEMQQIKVEVIMWVAGMFIASGLIQHFFK